MVRGKLLRPYALINLIFIGLIISLLLYSIVFSAEKSNYPIRSNYTSITGKTSISNGLSHSFSEIIRLNFGMAKEYNLYGLRIFIFFFSQLLLRIVLTVIILKTSMINRMLIMAELTFTTALFTIIFWPFINELMRVLREYTV